jgi:hypothetical protein
MRWLVREWPYAAIFTAVFLLLLLPFVGTQGLAFALIYLQLPLYMIHQLEEHDRDRFRQFFNQVLAGGREGLTPMSVFIINSVGVWGIDLLAIYLAFYVNLAWGLIAIYLPLLNAVSHIGMALALRRYNPGLWTSILLFLPFGIWALITVSRASHAGWQVHAATLGAAILLHAIILFQVKLRLRRLSSSSR